MPVINDETFGSWFREQRKRAGLKQHEMARRLGLKSPQFISAIEHNKQNIPEMRVSDYALQLGIGPEVLRTEMEKRGKKPQDSLDFLPLLKALAESKIPTLTGVELNRLIRSYAEAVLRHSCEIQVEIEASSAKDVRLKISMKL